MISFNNNIDLEPTLSLFRRIFEGMSNHNFDDETGIAHSAGIQNLVFDDYGDYFTMSFDCIYGHVSVDYSKRISMKVNLKSFPFNDAYTDEEREKFLYTVSPDKNTKDYVAITKIIHSLAQENPEKFRLANQFGDDIVPVIYINFGQIVSSDSHLSDLLINVIGKQLGFITSDEASILNDIFALGNEPIHREQVTHFFVAQFDKFFDTLKEHGHGVGNEFDFNDMDNFLHYVVSQDKTVKGIVLRSQNHMFLFAKNIDTGVIKIWNTMQLSDNPEQKLFYKLDGNHFDGVQYMYNMLHSRYGQSYEYPFEFEANYHRKLPETLIENFESAEYNAQLIYSSDAGFHPAQNHKFESCISTIDWSCEVLFAEYDVEQVVINNSSIDYRSPTYVIRQLTNNGHCISRVDALIYLFTIMGNGFYWDNDGISNGSNLIEELEQNDFENKIEPITSEVFKFGNACMIFHRPDDISEDWLAVIREFTGYYKEWVDNHPEPDSAQGLEARNRLNLLLTI